jgi:hypothetical protein
MSFLDHRGLYVVNMSSDFTYKRKFNLTTLIYPLKNQNLITSLVIFSDFTDKVSFDVKIKPSKIATTT